MQEGEGHELATAIGQIAAEFKLRAACNRDFRSACFYLALEQLRIRWEAGAWPNEPIDTGLGDRR